MPAKRFFTVHHTPEYCKEFTDKLDCMGAKKFNHTLKAANKLVSQGITSVKLESPGVCPLDTGDPFPSS